MKLIVPFAATLLGAAGAAASSLKPPVLPLAVRNPYLSMWYNARANPWDTWPMFWTGAQLGVGIMAQTPKDSRVYSLLGRPQDALDKGANYTYTEPTFEGFQFDSCSTSLKYDLGGSIKVELLWTSPITSDSMMRQSIPASYLEIKVSGTQDVNIYMDVNGMWSTGDRAAPVVWNYTRPAGEAGLQSWLVQKQTQMLFTENSDRSEWGNFYFTAPEDAESISYQSAESGPMRRQFAATGKLNNNFETDWRTVLDREPAFAYVKKFPFSSNNTSESSVLYTLALVQDPITQFASATGYRAMEPLWKAYYDNDAELLQFHYADYKNATTSAAKFSERVKTEATELVSDTYADITALSARQVIGATYFSGTPDDPILFLKEISSNGNFQTVDVIFPAFPFLLYLNPDWVAYLLEPLLEHQMAGLYPNLYSIHDLGSHFPNATGHSDGNDEPMPVEESGNMLIMALAYIYRLGEMRGPEAVKEWVNREGRYHLWTQWTQFLIDKGLIPDNQLSTDDFAGTLQNQTNLAVKALIGIRAMSQISAAVGNTTDAEKYLKISDEYLPQWQEFAVSRDGTHTKLAYHWYGSWGSLYNQYADALLCFHLKDAEPAGPYFPYEIYRNQSTWYHNVHQKYGLPLDSRHFYTKSDWELWTAAISAPETRDEIINAMGTWLNETTTDRAFTDLYDTETGGFPGIYFMARPVAGGHFSILTLNSVCDGKGYDGVKAIYSSDTANADGQRTLNVEASLEKDRVLGRKLGLPVQEKGDSAPMTEKRTEKMFRWRNKDSELK